MTGHALGAPLRPASVPPRPALQPRCAVPRPAPSRSWDVLVFDSAGFNGI